MTAQNAIDVFSSAVDKICRRRNEFVWEPDRDFTRFRKLYMNDILSFLVTQGSQTTDAELADFSAAQDAPPSESALSRQRAKLKSEAVEALLHEVNNMLDDPPPLLTGWTVLAADGTKLPFPSDRRYAGPKYYTIHENNIPKVCI